MIDNHISAFVLNGLDHTLLDHPHLRYITQSLKMNTPLTVVQHNHLSLNKLLYSLLDLAVTLPKGIVYKAVFLVAFFGF